MSSIQQVLEGKPKLPSSLSYSLFLSFIPLLFIFLLKKWFFSISEPITRRRLPPSPPKLPILGNFHQLGSSPHRSLQTLARRYGPVMLLRLGRVPTLVISSADAAREIMKTHDVIFADRPHSSIADRLLYDSKDVSVAPYGEYWRQMKSVYVLQLLSNRKVQLFSAVREEEAALMVKKIEESCGMGLAVNLSEMFPSLTNDIISRAAFGKKYGEGESGKKFKKLLTDFLLLFGRHDIGAIFPWLGWVSRFNGFDAEVDRVAKEIDEFLEKIVEQRLSSSSQKEGDNCGEVQDEGKWDFVDILLRIYQDNTSGIQIDRDCIKAVILTVFSAGTDTTSTFLEWAMTELIRHPTIMNKVQNEVRQILSGRQDITEADLEQMHYLRAVIKETFRLHPPIPLLVPRSAREDVRVMGYDIPARTMVMVNAWAIGRDSACWDEPEEFQPERFLNSPVDFRGHDFQLIPFGAGRRGCPGISFAMAANELVLAKLMHKFDWALPGGAKGEDLDIDECSLATVTVRRRIPLVLVATPHPC